MKYFSCVDWEAAGIKSNSLLRSCSIPLFPLKFYDAAPGTYVEPFPRNKSAMRASKREHRDYDFVSNRACDGAVTVHAIIAHCTCARAKIHVKNRNLRLMHFHSTFDKALAAKIAVDMSTLRWNIIEKLFVTFSTIFIIDFHNQFPEMNSLGKMNILAHIFSHIFSLNLNIYLMNISCVKTCNEFYSFNKFYVKYIYINMCVFICAFIATIFVVSLVTWARLVDITALLRLYAKRIRWIAFVLDCANWHYYLNNRQGRRISSIRVP